MSDINFAFPAKFQPLFEPKRFKVLYGGRSAGRSWACARAALILGMGQVPGHPLNAPLRVLCARELQNSIAESIHRLLADQIELMKLDDFYEIQRDHIYGRKGSPAEGTIFSFEGIRNNVLRIKSYEGVQLVIVEEAVKVSQYSWGVLIPTIRRPNSEIWMNFNPELESDYTYRRFVLEADPDSCTVIHATFRDNPWLDKVVIDEIERDRRRDMDYYLNVWEGHPIQQLEGAVYAKELRRAQEDGRITAVGWDPDWPVETAWDLGRADGIGIWFYQRIAMQHRIIEYHDNVGSDISDELKVLQDRPYIYAMHHLPHDARAKRYGTKKTIEEIIRQHYPEKVRIVPKLSLSDGINATRMLLRRCHIDEKKCADGLKGMRHYHYTVRDGQYSTEPSHEPPWAEAAASSFRYMAIDSGNSSSYGSVFDSQMAQISKLKPSVGRISGALGWLAG